MFSISFIAASLLLWINAVSGLRYFPEWEEYNLNTNKTATDPKDYNGAWEGHVYQKSPDNWRMPFYTIFLDRFANGDPRNDNINETAYEHDPLSNQLRAGGDITGLMESLDYLQGMGVKAFYLAGSPFINQPWAADSFSPLDLTLLDHHFGNITAWREAITEIHRRGMYVVLDNTMSTMGDLIGFDGYLNTTTPFKYEEHKAVWKSSRRYWDFDVENDKREDDCTYPRFWTEQGDRVGSNVTDNMKSCLLSDFDQYGDVASFGTYPEWQKQLSKFGFVQDRLREWRPSVLNKIKLFSCIAIKMLDIDGYRIDKALTITLDAQADWSEHMRQCAKDVGKDNFFISGEIVSGNTLAALWIGRGKEPQMALPTLEDAYNEANSSAENLYIRNTSAVDSAAFHYSVYRSLTRFLGIDGIYAAERDTRINWAEGWEDMVKTNDMTNVNTGKFDPRHLYGVTNQDVFRWPAITNGTQKNLVGMFVTTLIMPGIPILMWGEEQAFYVLENTAGNYIFGRQPLVSTLAWQLHGCYRVGSEKYTNFPLDSALYGCEDMNVGLDHRDPSHPIRITLKRMYQLREEFPTLNDGFDLTQLSNHTHWVYLPGSGGTGTELGLWSVVRKRHTGMQDFSGQGQGNEMVWLLYGNENTTTSYEFDCTDESKGLISPFSSGTTVKNMFYPYEEYTLVESPVVTGFENTTGKNGCIEKLNDFPAWGFKAFARKERWVAAAPSITQFNPGHDYRLESRVKAGEKETIEISFGFSEEMDCDSVREALSIESDTDDHSVPELDKNTIKCATVDIEAPKFASGLPTHWSFKASLNNVANGVHRLTITNATASSGGKSTGAVDRFLLRVGQLDNPMIFPRLANYSSDLVSKSGDNLIVKHRASGASKFRCSRTWASDWTDWMEYNAQPYTMPKKNWTGTDAQDWKGEHVQCQYWGRLASSAAHVQEGELDKKLIRRRFPHVYVHGSFNEFGYDSGLKSQMKQNKTGHWIFDFMGEWPSNFQFNVWGMNPDGIPDQTWIFGDVDHDKVLDRLPPGSLIQNVVNITDIPPLPYAGWRLGLDDSAFTYNMTPTGSFIPQIILFVLLWILPPAIAAGVIFTYIKSLYQVKFNEIGVSNNQPLIPLALKKKFGKGRHSPTEKSLMMDHHEMSQMSQTPGFNLEADAGGDRRKVLIATMEYDIEDWQIKIKIGGLGVMAQLMGKNLGHQDLIWVVPCVGGIDYPLDQPAEPMMITILGKQYKIDVQYHVLRNITYVLLDAPVFRQQTKSDPYPARMDDLDSAILYSAWNTCIAEAIKRFEVDIYHINDYHGALAPLHLLPDVIPACLSLHNAEFQGLWPMRTEKEAKEVCDVFNIDLDVAKKYVQFGEVFNLLHAGASYLRVHQKGFGAVGVSKKYGKRSYARYPIFWGLSKIRSLPNPDPTDTAEWHREDAVATNVTVDRAFEDARADLKRQAQEWAGLEQKADAELFVFVGRWSMQKGVDLIADVFPSILENYPKVQVIAVGPVIDLYGRFAALKLEKMMKLYPGRVFSRPEFTALPPFIFSGAEFALIPSRDEPFGLVAVEFGRKGALGVGSRVGGLGQMPGWWFTIESNATKHMIAQFKAAIHDALASDTDTRAMMRARSAKQRFPVAQWVEDLSILQSTSIKISKDERHKHAGLKSPSLLTVFKSRPNSPNSSQLDITWPLSQGGADSNSSLLKAPPSPIPTPGNRSHSDLLAPSPQLSPQPNSPYMDSPTLSLSGSPNPTWGDLPVPGLNSPKDTRRFSNLSINSVVGERTDFALQKVDPFFNDQSGHYYREFETKLDGLGAKNSEDALCIEEYLVKSEKKWFDNYRGAKLGSSSRNASALSLHKGLKTPELKSSAASISTRRTRNSFRGPGPTDDNFFEYSDDEMDDSISTVSTAESFALGDNYVPPSGLKRLMLRKVGDWPIYSLFLAFGQIIAANSYQITLLTGEVGQSAATLYVIATIYAISSCIWWLAFRRVQSVYVLSIPFIFYGFAFLMVGVAPFVHSYVGRNWVQKLASACYTVASASGSIFFALNFGDEGGAPVKEWVLRACIIQGTQQAYVSALWYWGSALTRLTSQGVETSSLAPVGVIAGACMPLAFIMFGAGACIFIGLPTYYRQTPGKVPSFYMSIFRRKIILWFFVAVAIQNFWLASPYGRNWRFLWTTKHASGWQILLLVIFFFGFVWAGCLFILGRLSKAHSWILPVFAIGLGAPRWAQMLWGISGIASYLPWAGSGTASALLARALWLWLGVLDALQGVGFGMILLQTMTRFHNTFTLIAAQVLGSLATMLGRAIAPDKIGPGPVFPNLALGAGGLANAWFWICLLMQISICVGFAMFFRKEQLSKP